MGDISYTMSMVHRAWIDAWEQYVKYVNEDGYISNRRQHVSIEKPDRQRYARFLHATSLEEEDTYKSLISFEIFHCIMRKLSDAATFSASVVLGFIFIQEYRIERVGKRGIGRIIDLFLALWYAMLILSIKELRALLGQQRRKRHSERKNLQIEVSMMMINARKENEKKDRKRRIQTQRVMEDCSLKRRLHMRRNQRRMWPKHQWKAGVYIIILLDLNVMLTWTLIFILNLLAYYCSSYTFKEYDPNKKRGKKKAHHAFKSRSKYKRRWWRYLVTLYASYSFQRYLLLTRWIIKLVCH